MSGKFVLLVLLAIGAVTLAYIYYLRTSTSPTEMKLSEDVKRNMGELDKELTPSAAHDVAVRRKISSKFVDTPVIGLSQYKKMELERMLDSIAWKPGVGIKVDDVYFIQFTNLCICIAAGMVCGLIWPPLFLIVLLAPVFFWSPVRKIKRIAEYDSRQIQFEFPDFYDMVYVQYSERNVNILLSDVVAQYMPIAGPAFKNMLQRFLIDLSSGEDFALEQLDKRYLNNSVIHRFSSIMRQRLKGEEASFVSMFHFREELQAEVHDWMENDLEKRKEAANRLIGIMILVILTLVMIIYFINFFKASVA